MNFCLYFFDFEDRVTLILLIDCGVFLIQEFRRLNVLEVYYFLEFFYYYLELFSIFREYLQNLKIGLVVFDLLFYQHFQNALTFSEKLYLYMAVVEA